MHGVVPPGPQCYTTRPRLGARTPSSDASTADRSTSGDTGLPPDLGLAAARGPGPPEDAAGVGLATSGDRSNVHRGRGAVVPATAAPTARDTGTNTGSALLLGEVGEKSHKEANL